MASASAGSGSPLPFCVIYLDNNATTRPSPRVVSAVREAMEQAWFNPSSVHRAGQAARQGVELARAKVAALIGAKPREIVFTSSGTEAIDLCIRGVLGAARRRSNPRRVLVTSKVEHAAVRDLAQELETGGEAEIRWIPVHPGGAVNLDAAAEIIDQDVAIVSIQWANNETGVIQPVEALAGMARSAGAVFHCDATQWVGKEITHRLRDATSAIAFGFDLMTFAPHKFHGPKGVGVVWAKAGLPLRPRIIGTQELGRRGGTENVEAIIGAGVAAEEAIEWLEEPEGRERGAALRDRLEQEVLAGVPGAVVNAPPRTGPGAAGRLWNTTNIGFAKLEAEAMLIALSEMGVCASAGAACSSGSLEPSPVLLAMGVPEAVAHGSLRFSLSRETTREEIDEAARAIITAVRRVAGSGV